MFIPKSHFRWLAKAAKQDWYYPKNLIGYCHVINGQSWLATTDGYRLHAIACNLPSGSYYIAKDGCVMPCDEKILEWTVMVSWRYQESFAMERPTVDKEIKKFANLEVYEIGNSYVNMAHLLDAFSFAKYAMVSIPVDPMPGIKISFNPGVNQAFAIISRAWGDNSSNYPPVSLKYGVTSHA